MPYKLDSFLNSLAESDVLIVEDDAKGCLPRANNEGYKTVAA